ALLTPENRELPEHLECPLFVKPNYEGSSKGISVKSVCESPEEVMAQVEELLEEYPEGVNVEEFIRGKELSVPMLEGLPGGILEVVEHKVEGLEVNIFDYRTKQGEGEGEIHVECPAELTPEQRRAVMGLAQKVFEQAPCPDLGRVDIRLREEDGVPFFIERNPLPSLHPEASMMIAARARDLEFAEVLDLIVRSAAQRYGLRTEPTAVLVESGDEERKTARELGISVGRFRSGEWNAITDVKDVRVGHVTHIREEETAEGGDLAVVRTGVTAIVPGERELLHKQLVAGGFILNGVGEVSGLTQAMEWGWLETPILLTNTMSVGVVHAGLISHLVEEHPELGREIEVLIPLIGETDDSFLNDVRAPALNAEDAIEALKNAKDGPVEQGSVGGGTGMVSFDFAGGIGSSSRVLPSRHGGYTVGVLVQSNFGKMRNLTVDGSVIGRELDPMFPTEGRRGKSYGSVLVVVATDAPLLSTQLEALSRRAALGLGRVGSWAATTSGEIVLSFSTGNRVSRKEKAECLRLGLSFVTDRHMNPLYEAVVEATEEAVLNAMFCSGGMDGREGRYSPPIPSEKIVELMNR
ncbi:MAG: P1 family peptidase, partial [Thermoanaerobaculia bacterium]|nr:P1 family peptidase [Thermoanaerobaculia bacterium]